MSYYGVFFLLAILIVSSNGKPTDSVAAEPERCCVPNQYSAQTSTSTGIVFPDGKLYTSYAYYNYSYDFNRGMIAMRGAAFTQPDQVKTNLWVIELMNTGQIYTLYVDIKRCDKAVETLKPLHCIGDTASFARSFSYGYGSKQIIGNTWLIKGDGYTSYSTVSGDGQCVPLTETVYFQQAAKPSMITTVTTTGFIPEIIDPSVFDIPLECQTLL